MSKGTYTSSHVVHNWAKVLRVDPCCYCGGPGGTVDHIFPMHTFRTLDHRPSFGVGGWQNLTGACAECNMKKGSMGLLEFLVGRNKVT